MNRTAKQIATLFALIQLVLFAAPTLAQESGQSYGNTRTVATETWIEEWDPATSQWVRLADSDVVSAADTEVYSAARYAQPTAAPFQAATLAQYGPFVVTSATSASMVGSTDTASPAQFAAMLRDFPLIGTLQLVEAPGTSNDIANLEVGRRIREAGIATHVPSDGSVRSGAVELFLAGAVRTMDQGAQFAVHSWLDNHGREAGDLSADHPAHRLYIDYYMEMGMTETRARDFYAMTNSVPHSSALWLGAGDMQPWLRPAIVPVRTPAFRMAAARPEVLVATQRGGLQLAIANWKMELQPVAIPALTTPALHSSATPSLHYVDLNSLTLAEHDSVSTDQHPLPA